MVKEYTEIWNGFQIREPVFLTGKKDPYMFDLVKWEDHDPIEVTELSTGERKYLRDLVSRLEQSDGIPENPDLNLKAVD